METKYANLTSTDWAEAEGDHRVKVPIYRKGDLVPLSGVYFEHGANGLKMNEAYLIQGDTFPANAHPSFYFALHQLRRNLFQSKE